MDRATAVVRVKSGYASGAQAAGRVLRRAHLLGEQPPSRDDRLRHWAFSLTRAHDSLAIAELDVPWWTYRAIDVVDAWLSARRGQARVFEYGSGASTIWLARRAREVHSVEHHRGFAEHMATALGQYPNVDLRIVEPVASDAPAVASAKEGHGGLDFAAYVARIDGADAAGGQFDLVVVDGRAREACLRAALPHLAPDGLIVFDNSRRARYRRAIAAEPVTWRRLRGLTPTLPYPDETSLLTLR